MFENENPTHFSSVVLRCSIWWMIYCMLRSCSLDMQCKSAWKCRHEFVCYHYFFCEPLCKYSLVCSAWLGPDNLKENNRQNKNTIVTLKSLRWPSPLAPVVNLTVVPSKISCLPTLNFLLSSRWHQWQTLSKRSVTGWAPLKQQQQQKRIPVQKVGVCKSELRTD